jgi:hypothetical protein
MQTGTWNFTRWMRKKDFAFFPARNALWLTELSGQVMLANEWL